MSDLVIFGLFFAAVAIGWMLGQRQRNSADASGQYFTGGKRKPHQLVIPPTDSFAEALAVDDGSTQSRIAMGVQMRRRGEVDGAVRIHQDLAMRTSLPTDEAAQVRLELARDFISAGLLDRAEELLLQLVEEFPGQREAARRHLLEVYEIERDWRRAIDVATDLLPRKLQPGRRTPAIPTGRNQRAALLLAHYCCELAEEQRLAGQLEVARKLLLSALSRDKQCVRASILLGQVEYDDGRYRHAVQALRRVRIQDSAYLPETIELLRKCYAALGEPAVLRDYLAECLAACPTAALVAAVADDMVQAEGRDAAGVFLAAQLQDYPSLPGLSQLIGLQLGASDANSREDLAVLQNLTQRLVAARPTYRCGHCGFAGKHLHWNCPGCRHWGSIKAIEGPGGP